MKRMVDNMSKGKFIVLDGIDGSGTTTHAKLLKNWLMQKGYAVVLTTEPSKRKIGTLIRKIIRTTETSTEIDALLFAADRLDHVEMVIKPGLAANKIVISDRYVESTIAYQTTAGLDIGWVLELNKFIINPDLTIILDIEPEIGLNRKQKLTDKFENAEFLRNVREIYLERAQSQHYPIITTNRSIDIVQEELQKYVQSIL